MQAIVVEYCIAQNLSHDLPTCVGVLTRRNETGSNIIFDTLIFIYFQDLNPTSLYVSMPQG
jgi:hypothetical protein